MAISLDYLLVEDAPPAAIITLNRPDQLNALSTGLMAALGAELGRQAARQEVRAIVIKGAGRAFSAGHDLKEMLDRSLDEEREIFAMCNKLMATVQSVPVPVIAAPHGIATAAGCQLVAQCDLAIASDDRRFHRRRHGRRVGTDQPRGASRSPGRRGDGSCQPASSTLALRTADRQGRLLQADRVDPVQ